MGDKDKVPKPVADLAAATGKNVLDHPELLPDPIGDALKAAKKLPDKIAADVAGTFGSPAAPGTPGTPATPAAPAKRPGAPDVSIKPDINPNPAIAGSSAGAHVTVTGHDAGLSYTATARASGGLDDKKSPQGKSGVDAGVTYRGGGDGVPHYSVSGRVEAGGALGPRATGHLGAAGEATVEISKGVNLGARVFGGVDAASGAGATPSYGGTVGLKVDLGSGGPARPASQSQGLSPGEALAAKIAQDQKLVTEAPTQGERDQAAKRLAAELKVQENHPEFGTRNMELKSYTTTPGDFTVQKMGRTLEGNDVKMPAKLQQEVQDEINRPVRTAAREIAQEHERARGQDRASQGRSV